MSAAPDTSSSAPLVSILVPSYNQGQFIERTLESILSQDYRPLEVVVVDGASEDNTVDVLREVERRHPELRWTSEPDSGVVEAVNKGFASARGTYCGIQSSDDVYKPGAISAAVQALETNPDVGVVYGDFAIIDEAGAQLGRATSWEPFTLEGFLARRTVITQYTAFFRLDLVRALGGWRDEYFIADEDLWHRMVFRAPALKLDRVLAATRRHPNQRDKQVAEIWESYGRMIAESEEIAAAPWRLRRAAAAGRRIMTQYYNPTGSEAFRMYQLWRAVLAYPPAIRAIRDKRFLLPTTTMVRHAPARAVSVFREGWR